MRPGCFPAGEYMIYQGIFDAKLEIPYEGEAFSRKGTVLIFPGGGYEHLSERESIPVAKALKEQGIRSAILYYDVTSPVLHFRPLLQAAWVVKKLREMYPGEPVVVLGFSSGGHCAANLLMHWRGRDWKNRDIFAEIRDCAELDEKIFRPDAGVLCYPVITSGEYAHKGSFIRLLGGPEEYAKDPEEYKAAYAWLSLETQVNEETPPVFLWQTQEDEEVPVENSLLLAQSLIREKIRLEYHVYPKGAHGLSLATKEVEQPAKNRFEDLHVAGWFREMCEWFKEEGIIKS